MVEVDDDASSLRVEMTVRSDDDVDDECVTKACVAVVADPARRRNRETAAVDDVIFMITNIVK